MSIHHTFAIVLVVVCISAISLLFWEAEYQYNLPTKIPVNYKSVTAGDFVFTANDTLKTNLRPAFLHFYNPDCPCSRFNIRHLRSLIADYNRRIEIQIVVQSLKDRNSAEEEFGNDVTYLIDHDHQIAKACGVYSTPQAAIVDEDGKLYFRGNYNQSRYCTSRATNFAELALLAFLNKQSPPVFDITATQSYGCELKSHNPYGLIN